MFICTNCGVNYVGKYEGKKQVSTQSPLPSVQKDDGKQTTRAKHKDGTSEDNQLRLPSIKATLPSSVSCTITN